MTWQDLEQLSAKYPDEPFRRAFSTSYSLSLLLRRAIFSQGFSPPAEAAEAVHLTKSGEAWYSRILGEMEGVSEATAKLAVFLRHGHQDLFVEVLGTDTNALSKLLEDGLDSGTIRFPWVYDRTLYDRCFEVVPERVRTLSYEQTLRILDGTPPGVFQAGRKVVGPFGVLESGSGRVFAPFRKAPTRHCSDPSCAHIDLVTLSPGESQLVAAADFVETELKRLDELPSFWSAFFEKLNDVSDYYDDLNTELLLPFIADISSEAELRRVLAHLLDHEAADVRTRLEASKKYATLLRGDGESVAGRLTKAQCFQLLLLATDSQIVESIETLIDKEIIRIPPTEKRTARLPREFYTWFDVTYECSRYGIRFSSSKSDIGPARLKRLITKTYDSAEDVAKLEWMLRRGLGSTILEKLEDFIHKQDPKQIVQELVFESPNRLRRAFALLRYGKFTIPASLEEENQLAKKILWKLGFDVTSYPDYQRLFWERLRRFVQVAESNLGRTEQDMELIRSAGTNFFVSLEEILDYSLSFVVWAVLLDHIKDGGFKFNVEDARKIMASKLSRPPDSSERPPLMLDPTGKNTLYPLMSGFAVLAGLCKSLGEDNEAVHLRKPEELPHFAARTELQTFPFTHTVFFLDLRKSDRERLIDGLRDVTRALEQSGIAAIRNRLDHNRPDFPSSAEIAQSCRQVTAVVQQMEASGICPVVYLYAGTTEDQYRRGTATLKDYLGRDVSLLPDSQFQACGLPSIDRPLVFVPGMRIGTSSEPMRLQFEESSDYARTWRGFPRRRFYFDQPTPVPAEPGTQPAEK